jgi:hypothetical protein
MEREILLGIDFSLYVNKTTYESWLNLLKGLVMAKEKDGNVWKKNSYSRGRNTRSARAPVPPNTWSTSRSTDAYATPTRPNRARSTSPSSQSFRYPFTFTSTTQPTLRPTNDQPSKPGAKRSAEDAFSPTSTSFPPIKAPRRNTPALSLSIPGSAPINSSPAVNHGVKSGSPLDNLPFSKLSLASNSPAVTGSTQNAEPENRMWVSSSGQHVPPKTLSAAWPLQERERTWAAPQVRELVRLRPSLHSLTLNVALTEPILLLARLLSHLHSESTGLRTRTEGDLRGQKSQASLSPCSPDRSITAGHGQQARSITAPALPVDLFPTSANPTHLSVSPLGWCADGCSFGLDQP